MTAVELSFEVVDRFRPVGLIAPGFVAVDTQSAAASRPEELQRADTGPVAPFASVEVRTTASLDAWATAGLATADGEQVLVRWSDASELLTIEVRRNGRTKVLRRRKLALSGAFGLGFALCENQVTALVDTGSGWRPMLTERRRVARRVDLRREDVLSAHTYAWGSSAPAGVRAGIVGMTGMRDPHLVTHADGTAYERDGRHYLTWTTAGYGHFQQAHWTVWSLDPADPGGMRLESQLFTRRDGMVLGDHAGQLVRDGERWLVATSAWGDFQPGKVHVRHCTTTADLLTGTHLLETEPTPLPTHLATWDPAIMRVGDTWHVAFVESRSQSPFTFHPALARTSADEWWQGLTPVASMDDLRHCEGMTLVTIDGSAYLVASDEDARDYPVFDLDGERMGQLDAPYLSNIPHPALLPDPSGRWLLLTFNGREHHRDLMGYGSHGDVVVMRERPADGHGTVGP